MKRVLAYGVLALLGICLFLAIAFALAKRLDISFFRAALHSGAVLGGSMILTRILVWAIEEIT